MNTQLQKIIEELKAEKEKAKMNHDEALKESHYYYCFFNKGQLQAFSLCIENLTKILNEGSVAATPKNGIEEWVQDEGLDASF